MKDTQAQYILKKTNKMKQKNHLKEHQSHSSIEGQNSLVQEYSSQSLKTMFTFKV